MSLKHRATHRKGGEKKKKLRDLVEEKKNVSTEALVSLSFFKRSLFTLPLQGTMTFLCHNELNQSQLDLARI